MELDFRHKSYSCEYYSGYIYFKLSCFSKKYDNITYNNRVYATYIIPKEQRNLSYTFLSHDQLLDYFIEISKLLGFKIISFSETDTEYKLQINTFPHSRYFLFISTIIRYTYEHPTSILLYFAIINRHNFPELNIIQIVQFYIGMFFNSSNIHIIGTVNYVVTNLNVKCYYNTISNYYNDYKKLIYVTNHIKYTKLVHKFNTKQLSQITEYFNTLANNEYAKRKESICCW